ncbi:MAG: VWA domain-containing protein [bacterium]|nr:VWA domain-containing protein [bacterium]
MTTQRFTTRLAATMLPALTIVGLGATAAPAGAATTPSPDSDTHAGKLVLVLDASGSMEWEDASGGPRIEAAKTALHSVIDSLPEDANVGFRVFGATEVGLENPASCEDSQLLVPIGAANKDALRAATEQYAPFGETPIGYALQQAAADLGTEGQRSILLVSDGESNCQPDPCEVARELAADGIDLTINTVGMNVEGAARDHLQCVASATGGTYFDASDAETLTQAMDTLALRAFRPFGISGTPVQGTTAIFGAPTLTPGEQYTDVLPAPRESSYYTIPRQWENSSIHVGLTARAQQSGTTVRMRLWTTDRDRCGYGAGSAQTADAAFGLLSVSLVASGSKDPGSACATAETLVLEIEGSRRSGPRETTPFEMIVVEEPALAAGSTPPEAQGESGRTWSLGIPHDGAGGQVVPGSSFNDATLLAPGSYRSEVLTGETQVYAVELDWGQRLQARVETDQVPLVSPLPTAATVQIYSPLRGAVSDNWSQGDGHRRTDTVSRFRPSIVATTMDPVQWQFQQQSRSENTPLMAGTHYVVLSVDERSNPALLPYTLTLEVVGTAGEGAPTYDPQPIGGVSPTPEPSPSPSPEPTPEPTTTPTSVETSPSAAPTESGSTGEPTAPPEEPTQAPEATTPLASDDDGASPILIGALALGGVSLVGGGVWALTRPQRV